MKKTIIYISVAAALFVAACTKKFDALNTNPTAASASNFDPNLLLPSGVYGYVNAVTGYSGPILFQSMWVQTFASAVFPGYYSNGDKYVQGGSYLAYQASTWDDAYQAASYLREAQNLSKGNTAYSNLSGISKILELLNIEAITDVYGDAPFSQALQAKTGISQPVYDKQQDIYTNMLSQLDSVIPTLSATLATTQSDVIYGGDVTKWKKFGYSLMLRMAMRLTKVDATTAQKYAEKAYAGGVFASNDDNASIAYDVAHGFGNNNTNAYGVGEDFSEVKWGKVLVDYLKSTADPRLGVIAEVPQPGKAATANGALTGDHTPANQQGMPNGYDQNAGATDISHAPGYPGASGTGADANPTGNYSRPTPSIYLGGNNAPPPTLILTYAQTEYLLAEAAVNGWSVGASAATHYNNATIAALTVPIYGTVSSTTATTYAAAHPLDVSSNTNSLIQINTEYWVYEGIIFDFDEAWSNWRRSGYPVLTPVNYVGNFTNATIPRRQSYPTGEASSNPANYKTAVANLAGGDLYTGRVWWDK